MKVAVHKGSVTAYTEQPPFHPPAIHPEIGAAGFRETLPDNAVYDAVRNALLLLGLDADHYGTPEWNPFGSLIRRGASVLIKPNLVSHEHGPQVGQRCLTTHGAVIRAVVDYAFIAAGPESKIVIADAPVQGADFDKLLAQSGLGEIRDFYRRTFQYELGVHDLRQVRAVLDEQSALIRRVEELPGDPNGYSLIDLGDASRLRPLDGEGPRYAVGDYDEEVTNRRHRGERHEYVIANSVLDADVVISVPKLKTHSKVGLTMALKNIVGIVGSKDCLPHHRQGVAGHGGDEFPRDYPKRWRFAANAGRVLQGHVPRWMWRTLRSTASLVLGAGTPSREVRPERDYGTFFPSGSWYGNDTIWRTVDDLNRILTFWSRASQRFEDEPQRRCFTLVDGIVSMEGNGPLKGTARPTGVILAGDDALALDVTAASLIGFDWRKMNMLAGMVAANVPRRYSAFRGDTCAIEVASNVPGLSSVSALSGLEPHLPPAGWRSHVEI
ncbi:MAG: hypothetical protein QOE68_3906 [Thermoanaerobaculia bacterium]|jgi:uncharacterized protein (DUF362 family)|nr:hypothetical protein [Thermoanaerobaculia bacterium]